MDNTEIYAELTTLFHDILDDDSLVLTPDLTANDVKAWDSLAHVNIIVSAEMRFGIKFHTAELESLRNVGQLVRLIGEKLSCQEAKGR